MPISTMRRDFNYQDQLVNYIKKNLKKGYTKESLKWALIDQGNSRIQMDRAFKRAEEEMARQAPILKTKPKITYELVEPKIEDIKVEKKSFWGRFFS